MGSLHEVGRAPADGATNQRNMDEALGAPLHVVELHEAPKVEHVGHLAGIHTTGHRGVIWWPVIRPRHLARTSIAAGRRRRRHRRLARTRRGLCLGRQHGVAAERLTLEGLPLLRRGVGKSEA